MFAIEFQAHIKDGIIEIPAEQHQLLRSKVNGDPVRIIVLTSEEKQVLPPPAVQSKSLTEDAKEKGYDSFLDYLLDHPVQLPVGESYLSREEANVR